MQPASVVPSNARTLFCASERRCAGGAARGAKTSDVLPTKLLRDCNGCSVYVCNIANITIDTPDHLHTNRIVSKR